MARIDTPGQPASTACTSAAHGSNRCSQLSTTTQHTACCHCDASDVVTDSAPSVRTPAAAATVVGTSAGSATPAEVDEPHPVWVVGERPPGHLDGQAGLADAGRADQRDQPDSRIAEELAEHGQFGASSDQWCR